MYRSAKMVAHSPFSGRSLSVSADLEWTSPKYWAENPVEEVDGG
jgi:hypothetical protein